MCKNGTGTNVGSTNVGWYKRREVQTSGGTDVGWYKRREVQTSGGYKRREGTNVGKYKRREVQTKERYKRREVQTPGGTNVGIHSLYLTSISTPIFWGTLYFFLQN